MTPFSKRNTLQQQQRKKRSLQAAEVLKPTDKTTAFTEFNPNRSNINQMPEKNLIWCEQLCFFLTNKTHLQTVTKLPPSTRLLPPFILCFLVGTGGKERSMDGVLCSSGRGKRRKVYSNLLGKDLWHCAYEARLCLHFH